MFKPAKLILDSKRYDILLENNSFNIKLKDDIFKNNTYDFRSRGFQFKFVNDIQFNSKSFLLKNIIIIYENQEFKGYSCNYFEIPLNTNIYWLKFDFYTVRNNLRKDKLNKLLL